MMMEANLLRISTPLRTILIESVSDAGLNPLEQEMVTKYEQLHNELFALTCGWRKAEADVRALGAPQERIKKELQALTEESEGYRSLVREEPDNDDVLALDPQTLSMYGEDVQYFFDVYKQAVLAFQEDYKKIVGENDKIKSTYEDFDNNHYSKIKLDYENSTIDLITFDEEFNEFNIMMDNLSELIYKTANDYKSVAAEYEKITHEMGEAFKTIELFSQEITSLRATRGKM